MLARIARFEGGDPASSDAAVARLREDIQGPPPPGLEEARGVTVLHDRENGRTLAIVLFDDHEALRRGDAALNAMSPPGGQGRRASVETYEVVVTRTMG